MKVLDRRNVYFYKHYFRQNFFIIPSFPKFWR